MPALAGGVLTDGSYVLTEAVEYNESSCCTSSAGAATLMLSGDAVQLAVYSAAASTSYAGTLEAQGGELDFHFTCPTALDLTSPGYEVIDADHFRMIDPASGALDTFTRVNLSTCNAFMLPGSPVDQTQLDSAPPGSQGGAVATGAYALGSFTVYTGPGGPSGPSGNSVGGSFVMDPSGFGLFAIFGGTPVGLGGTVEVCDGMLIADELCTSFGPQAMRAYSEFTADTTGFTQLSGTEELRWDRVNDFGDAVPAGTDCETDTQICGGVPNAAAAVTPQHQSGNPAPATGGAPPADGTYVAVADTLYDGQPANSTAFRQFTVRLANGALHLADRRTLALSTRASGTFSFSNDGNLTLAFAQSCPSASAVAFGYTAGADSSHFSLNLPPSLSSDGVSPEVLDFAPAP